MSFMTYIPLEVLFNIEDGLGQIDGVEGDQFLIAPPLIVTEEQVEEIARRLRAGLEAAAEKLARKQG